MRTKLLTLLLLFVPVFLTAQNYEKEGDDLFAQAQYDKAAKKYEAAIAIVGETPAIKQKQSNCQKCKTLLSKAQKAEKESRFSDAAKHYSDLYAIHPLSTYSSKANAMKQKAKQATQEALARQQAEEERQTRLKAEKEAAQKWAQREAQTERGRLGNNIQWELYKDTLTISGEGKMEDIGPSGKPWGKYVKVLIIKNGVTSIGKAAFAGCELYSATIPNSVTVIGESAFEACESLRSISIPNSVSCIEEDAFRQCKCLSNITLHNNLKRIGESAFFGCTGLTTIIIPGSIGKIEAGTFERCYNLEKVTIQNGVTHIGNYAFLSCEGLRTVSIPNSVISIGEMAFRGCWRLNSLVVPSSVTKIGESAFGEVRNVQYEGRTTQKTTTSFDDDDWNTIDEW